VGISYSDAASAKIVSAGSPLVSARNTLSAANSQLVNSADGKPSGSVSALEASAIDPAATTGRAAMTGVTVVGVEASKEADAAADMATTDPAPNGDEARGVPMSTLTGTADKRVAPFSCRTRFAGDAYR
jgi:phage terminase large subunit-like protein